jgi:uncharacterized repeat protein (TIGR03803 family)
MKVTQYRFSLGFALACATLLTLSLAVSARAQTVTILAGFNGANGDSPNAVVQGTDGNFYGAALSGGAFGHGDVFRVTPTGEITAIYSFGCTQATCYVNEPYSMVLGSDGSLYGVSLYGGKSPGQGSIYRMTLDGEFSGVYTFSPNDGENPTSIAQSSDGNLFGTASNGGEFGHGTFFRISTTGEVKGLHAFCSQPGCMDGEFPLSAIQGRDGNFYGVANQGGANGYGAIFELTAAGSYRVLYSFCSLPTCEDGGDPVSIVQDNDGNFFGTTLCCGGAEKFGTVFELTANHQFKHLYSFIPHIDGGEPTAGATLANDGNLYGVNLYGGDGSGTIYEVTPQGDFSLLYTFTGNGDPYAPLFQGTDGNFYGTTDPYSGYGTFFRLSNNLSPLVKTVPVAGPIGNTVLILGNNLTGSTSVTFNGVAAEFTVASDTYIEATVPAGATTGFVSVVTPAGRLDSNPQFVVTK